MCVSLVSLRCLTVALPNTRRQKIAVITAYDVNTALTAAGKSGCDVTDCPRPKWA